MAVINNEVYISSKWSGNSKGDIVTYNKIELEIGKNAFASLEEAAAAGKGGDQCILTDNKVVLDIPGEIKNLSTQGFTDLSASYSSPDYDSWGISEELDGMADFSVSDNETTGYTSNGTIELSGGEKTDLTGILNLTVTGGEYGTILGGKYTAKTVADKIVSTKTKLTTTNSFSISRTALGTLKMSGDTNQYFDWDKDNSYTGYASIEILENVSFEKLNGGKYTDTRTRVESLVYKTNTVTITDKSKKTNSSTGKAVFINPLGGNVMNYATITAQMDPFNDGSKKPRLYGLMGGNKTQTWNTTEKLIQEEGKTKEDQRLSWQENVSVKETATGTVRLTGTAVNTGVITGYATVDLSGEKDLNGKKVPDTDEGVAGQVAEIQSNIQTKTLKINRSVAEAGSDDNWKLNDSYSETTGSAGKVEITGKLGVPSVSTTDREYGFKVGQDNETNGSITGYKTVEVENAEIQNAIIGNNYTYKETNTSSKKTSAIKNGTRVVIVDTAEDSNYFEKYTTSGKLKAENCAIGTMQNVWDTVISGYSTVELDKTEVVGTIYGISYTDSVSQKMTLTTDTIQIDGKETVTEKTVVSASGTEIEAATGKITIKGGSTVEDISGFQTVVIGEPASAKNPVPERNVVSDVYGSYWSCNQKISGTTIATDGIPVSVTYLETVTDVDKATGKATVYNSRVWGIYDYQTVTVKNSDTWCIYKGSGKTTEKYSAKTDKKGVVTANGLKTTTNINDGTVTISDSTLNDRIYGYKNATLERVQLGSSVEISGEPVYKLVRNGIHTFDSAADYKINNWWGSVPSKLFRTYTYTRTESNSATGKLVMTDITPDQENGTELRIEAYATVSITGNENTPLQIDYITCGGNSKESYKTVWEYLGTDSNGQGLAKAVTTNEKETSSASGTATLKNVRLGEMYDYKTVNLVNVTGTEKSLVSGGYLEVAKYGEIQNWIFNEDMGWTEDGIATYTDAKGNAIDNQPKIVYTTMGSASLKDSSLTYLFGYQTVTLENSSVQELHITPVSSDASRAEFKAVKTSVNIKGAENHIGIYEGGSGNDTMTIAKGAVLDANGLNFGEGNDTLNISGILTTSAAKLIFGSGNDVLNIAKGGALRVNVEAGINLDDTFGGDGFGDQCKINGDLVLLGTRENILNYLNGPFAIKFSGSGAIATNTDTASLLASDWDKVYDIGTQEVARDFQSTVYETADNTMQKAVSLSDWLDADSPHAENNGWLCGEGEGKFTDTTDWFKFTLENHELAGFDGVQNLFIEGLTENDLIRFYDSEGNERPFTTLDDNSWVSYGDGTGSGYQAVDFSRWADGDYLLEISLGETRKGSAAVSYTISQDGILA